MGEAMYVVGAREVHVVCSRRCGSTLNRIQRHQGVLSTAIISCVYVPYSRFSTTAGRIRLSRASSMGPRGDMRRLTVRYDCLCSVDRRIPIEYLSG